MTKRSYPERPGFSGVYRLSAARTAAEAFSERSRTCDHCENEIPAALAICPYCGRPQNDPGESGRRFVLVMVAMAVMFGIAIAEHYLFFAQ